MKKSSARALMIILAICALALVFVSPANAQSYSASHPTGHCAVTSITLHGTQPATITCLKQSISTHGITPFTYRDYGCSSYNLIITDVYQNGYCFNGTGYLPYHITYIWGFTSNNYNGWFRMYPEGSTSGWFQDWNSPGAIYDFGVYDGSNSITQICINRSSPTTC